MTVKGKKSKSHKYGGALIAVYWAIAILSITVFTTLQFLVFEVSFQNSRVNAIFADQLAYSAASVAAHSLVENADPILVGKQSKGTYRAHISSENSRLNINLLLSTDRKVILENLFEIWGMDRESIITVTSEFIDWVDADHRPTGTSGKERGYYLANNRPDFPYNRPFRDLEEITLLNAYKKLNQAQPNWRNSFSVYATNNLDLNSAEADLIAAVCGCNLLTAQNFVENRNGPDGINLTEDDRKVESVSEGLDLLLTFGEDRNRVAPWFGINGSIKRIEAFGSSGDVTVEQVWILNNSSLLNFSSRRIRTTHSES